MPKKPSKLQRETRLADEVRRLREELAVERQGLAGELEQLREMEFSRQRYADLYDFAPVGYLGFDRSGCIRDVNLTAARLLGRERHHLLDHPLLPLVAKDDRRTWLKHLSTARREGHDVSDLRFETGNSEPLVLRFHTIHKPHVGRASLRGTILSSAMIDVTELKRAEDTIRRREERFRALIENAAETITVIGLEGTVQYQSPNVALVLGYEVGEMEGRKIFEFIDPQDQAAARDILVQNLKPGEVRAAAFRFRRKDGVRRWLHVTGKNLKDEPAVGGIVLNSRDITDQRQTEEALAEAARKKDEFLAMLAHELRNPMAAISAATAVLGHKNMSADRQEFARKALRERVQQLGRLVDDLLDVSKIIRGKVVLEREPLDLCEVVKRAAEAAATLFEERKQHFQVQANQELLVYGDPVRLEQIVSNLLTNAARYTPDGGHIELTASAQDGIARVSVRDDGAGIQPERIPEMFELFQQGDISVHRTKGGLGIGLAIVKKLTALHGGEVEAHSAGPKKGSEFVVVLPMLKGEMPEERYRAETVVEPGLRILIAEDHKDTAVMTAEILSSDGHKVEVASDGKTAVQLALEKPFDVVLLDLGLPGKDGFEVARELRQRGRDMPIIAVSGYGQERDRVRARAAGIDHHLLKPLDYSELIAILAAPRKPGQRTDEHV